MYIDIQIFHTLFAVLTHDNHGEYMPAEKVRVAILDDHQSIIDGYIFRFSRTPEIEVVAIASYGEELEPLLAKHRVDVLLLDLSVRTSPENPNPFPILHTIPKLLQKYGHLS